MDTDAWAVNSFAFSVPLPRPANVPKVLPMSTDMHGRTSPLAVESNIAADSTAKCLLLVNAKKESHEALGVPSPPKRSLLRGESMENRSPDEKNSWDLLRTSLKSVNEISPSARK